MNFHVYTIYSKKLDAYYTGYTSDLQRRLSEHNLGISSYSSKANDWIIMHVEVFETRELAHKRELEIKKKKSRKYIEWLISKKE